MESDPNCDEFRAKAALLVEKAHRFLKTVRQENRTGAKVGPESQLTTQTMRMLALYKANQHNSVQVQAALFSAVFELADRIPILGSDQRSDEELALQLINIATNRARRAERSQIRIAEEAQRGEARTSDESGQRHLDSVADKKDFQQIYAQLQELVGYMCSGLDSKEHRIFELAMDGAIQEEIAKVLGCHRSTVSRVLKKIYDRLCGLLDREVSSHE